MENLLLIKIEIVLLILSFCYIIYYISWRINLICCRVQKIVKKEEIRQNKKVVKKLSIDNKEKKEKKEKIKKIITWEELVYLNELIKRTKLNSSKGYFDVSKWLIIEWLSIDKTNKQLNLELANIYEKENSFKNAELIYKELREIYKDDYIVLKKLWYILILQNKLEEWYEVYNKIHKKKKADLEVIDMLWEISFKLEKYKQSLKFLNMYIKEKPRDADKLFMIADCYEYFREYIKAISTYKKILEFQPYNSDANNRIKELKTFMA